MAGIEAFMLYGLRIHPISRLRLQPPAERPGTAQWPTSTCTIVSLFICQTKVKSNLLLQERLFRFLGIYLALRIQHDRLVQHRLWTR